MSEKEPQTRANHARFIPVYHFATFGILAVNFIYRLYLLVTSFSFDSVMNLLVGFALLSLFLFARVFPLWAQDRVIRLEERLRYEEILPDDLQSRIAEVTRGQIIALRFASDEELGDLMRKCLTEKIEKQSEIKALIKNWKQDIFRV
jgi:hypothetical protein